MSVVVGQRYRVTISDCCVDATFTATLAEVVTQYPDDEEPLEEMYWGYRFDNGVVIEPGWHGAVLLDEAS